MCFYSRFVNVVTVTGHIFFQNYIHDNNSGNSIDNNSGTSIPYDHKLSFQTDYNFFEISLKVKRNADPLLYPSIQSSAIVRNSNLHTKQHLRF